MSNSIPTIDISPLFGDSKSGIDEVTKAVADACRSIGFFYIVNHSVPQALCDKVFSETQALFGLPSGVKESMDIQKSAHMRGYFSFGADKSDGIHGDIKEGFDLAADLPLDDPYVKAGLTFYGPNVWPQSLPDFKAVITEYHNSMLRVGRTLLKAFARGLGVPESFFEEKFRKPMAQLRLLRYPPSSRPGETQIGAGEHTDFGWITMIAQDETGGLEVLNRENQWVGVPPLPSSFVVNIGDLMSRWTNDVYTATFHRVTNRNTRDRYSVAFFMDPDYYVNVECLDTCVSESRPAKYAPIVVGDYMNRRFYETTTFRDRKPEDIAKEARGPTGSVADNPASGEASQRP